MKYTSLTLLGFALFSGSSLSAQSIVSPEKPIPTGFASTGHSDERGFSPRLSKYPLRYPAPENYGSSGAFAAWIQVDDSSAADGTIFSAGNPKDGWILLQVSEGKLIFLIQKGEKPFQADGECYVSVSTPISSWDAGSWHHVAVAWDAKGPNQSLVALWIDGESVEERQNATLSASWGPSTLFIGANSASAAAPKMAGTIDEVSVFAYAPTNEDILGLAKGDARGASLFVDFQNDADAMDLRAGKDDSAARAEARAKWTP